MMNRRNFLHSSAMAAAALGIAPGELFSAAPGKKPAKEPRLDLRSQYQKKLDRAIWLVRDLMAEHGADIKDLAYCGRSPWFTQDVRNGLAPNQEDAKNRFLSIKGECLESMISRWDVPLRPVYAADIRGWVKGEDDRNRVLEWNKKRLACSSQAEAQRNSCDMLQLPGVQDYELRKCRECFYDEADVLEYGLFVVAPPPAVRLAIYDVDQYSSPLEEAVFRRLFQNAGTMAIFKSYPIPGDPDFMCGTVGKPR